MRDLFIIGGSVIGVFGSFCIAMYKITNGRLIKELDRKVDRDACHMAQKGVHKRIDDLDRHITEKLDMALDLLRKNGTQ